MCVANIIISLMGKDYYVARIPIKRFSDSCNTISVELGNTESSTYVSQQKQNTKERLEQK